MPLAPFIHPGENRYSYRLGQANFFHIDGEFLLTLYLALRFLAWQFRSTNNLVVLSLVASGGALVVTTVVSFDPNRSWWDTLERIDGGLGILYCCAFFFIFAGLFGSQKKQAFFSISLE